ncbi:hypothetical protein QDY68_03700 [Kingella negevensis]|uniref:hypothetical protein n=1 Tax=Kingella negevensis TaxID=1522312 RepID=UPI00254F8D1E|nr:hypothetical protein [Kingella negevensis]MDK4707635.1 hypothetical protein [Kingella negevensis]MDK4709518.1 hypothetical protein [Kingella negevensis]
MYSKGNERLLNHSGSLKFVKELDMNQNEINMLNRQQQTMNTLLNQRVLAQYDECVNRLIRFGVLPNHDYTPTQKHILFNQFSLLMATGSHTREEWHEQMASVLQELGINQTSD